MDHSTVVDYENRCACMIIYDRNLAIIPFSSTDHSLYPDDPEFEKENLRFLNEKSEKSVNNSYTIHLPSIGIKNVKDIKFLYGYYEPTLMILYEPIGTWVGRLDKKRNTHCVAILSLNIEHQQHHLIWSVSNLPHDCYKILPLKSPGGACILSSNSILYLNQSSRYKLVLNYFGNEDEKDPLALKFTSENSPLVISLDNAKATFLRDNAVLLSIQSGELYVMNLVSDGRSIVHINLQKLGTSIISTCMCTLTDKYLFIGSKIEDSLLIRYFPKKEGPTSVKKRKKDTTKDVIMKKDQNISINSMPENAYDFIDQEDYNEDISSLVQIMLTSKTLSKREKQRKTRWAMKVVDSIISSSPISDIQIKKKSASEIDESHCDLISCSGYGNGGSLCVFRKGIRPYKTVSFDIHKCNALFSLHQSEENSGSIKINKKRKRDEENKLHYQYPRHKYLFISEDESTKIYDTGENIVDITGSTPFAQDKSTINAGNLYDNRWIIQIYDTGFVLVENYERLQEVDFEEQNRYIVWSQVLDPYVMIQLDNNVILLYSVSPKDRGLICYKVPEEKYFTFEEESLLTFCLFQDKTSSFTSNHEEKSKKDLNDVYKNTFFAAFVGERGTLRILNLNSHMQVFQCGGINNGRKFIENEIDPFKYWANINVSDDFIDSLPKISEIKIFALGEEASKLYLFLLLENNDVLVYHSYTYTSELGKITRFKRLNIIETSLKQSSKKNEYSLAYSAISRTSHFNRIIYFSNIAGKQGVFITGPVPMWFFSERDFLRVIDMSFEGEINSFSEMNNANSDLGFVYYSSNKSMAKFCELDSRWSLDIPSHGMTIYKAPIRSTPTSIVYDPDENVIVVMVMNKEKDMIRYLKGVADDRKDKDIADLIAEGKEPVYDINDVDPRYPPFYDTKYELVVLNGDTYEIEDRFKLKEEEVGVIKRVHLKYSGDESQTLHPFIAVAISTMRGEDALSKGRVALFEIAKKTRTNDDGSVTTFSSLSQRCSKTFRYAVTQIDSLTGVLSVAVGHRIYLLTLTTTSELVEIAFVDTQVYVVSMCTIKSFILCGDFQRSIAFLRWRDDERTLTVLGKDYGQLNIFSTGLLIDKKKLYFIISDDNANIFIYEYSRTFESHVGRKLLCIGDFHLGTCVNKFLKLKTKQNINEYPKYCSVYGGVDGSIGFLVPIGRETFQRLGKLEMRLVSAIPHSLGLNPKAFRLTKKKSSISQNHKRSVLDGELLKKFLILERTKQEELSNLIGSSRKAIIEDILQINETSRIFE